MTKMIALIGLTLLLSACGTASKDDICGDCSGSLRELCEDVYDACRDDGDCIDALEDSDFCG